MSRKPCSIAKIEHNGQMAINWHKKEQDSRTFGEQLADAVAQGMGSWTFIIVQSIIVVAWMVLNVIAFIYHWDEYPFILLNLVFSTQAAYAPIIMMSQNRSSERDREHPQPTTTPTPKQKKRSKT